MNDGLQKLHQVRGVVFVASAGWRGLTTPLWGREIAGGADRRVISLGVVPKAAGGRRVCRTLAATATHRSSR